MQKNDLALLTLLALWKENRSALSALFALLKEKVQKNANSAMQNLHEILEIVETIEIELSQKSQLYYVVFFHRNRPQQQRRCVFYGYGRGVRWEGKGIRAGD